MNDSKIQAIILELLKASEPCTLKEICEEIMFQGGIEKSDVLPWAIDAIAQLQRTEKICEYTQVNLNDPLEYAWLLSQESYLFSDLDESTEQYQANAPAAFAQETLNESY